ncbi:sensor histidine kinase [Paenibacillus xylanilyticus]
MTEAADRPKQKKKIQVNILIRMLLSLIMATVINNLCIMLFLKISTVMEWFWFRDFFPYILTPLFTVAFVLIFLILTRQMVRDLITLEEGLQTIAEGNLKYRVPVVRQDELGRVAHNINRMTERLEQQLSKEREIEKSKMDMITGISHDLRTPLTSIIGYIELLKSNSFQNEDEYNRFVQNTYNKAFHLKKLLDDLFEYTRLTSMDAHINLKRIDIVQLLEQITFEFEPIAQEQGIQIVKEIADSPIITSVDSDKMARAIDNLLMNALKYSLKPGTISIRLNSNHNQIVIEVENKGIPLTKDQQDQLFDRFYKVDHSRSNEGIQAGAGLGLAITKNIIELHHGSISLKHTDNIFIFQLTLPSEVTRD